MGFETVASGLLAAMISDEIGQEFGLGRGLELALSFAGSQETLPYYSKHPEERLIVGDGTQAAFVGAAAYPYWADDLQARVQKNLEEVDVAALEVALDLIRSVKQLEI
jgi:hypothetical protein